MALFKKKKQLDSNSMKNGVGLITVTKPTSSIAEQFRTIRTNVQFSSADRQLKTLLFTSADPSEGKSTISFNVAVTWADQGNKVLLIDSDLRRPTVARSFRVSNSQGLTTILTAKQANLSESIHETEVPNLYVLPSGPVPPNPSELLNSSKMDQLLKVLKEQFDIIILDVPPVNTVTDAQILASKVDGVILVVPQGIAIKGAVLRARDLLKKVNANLIIDAGLGFVFASNAHNLKGRNFRMQKAFAKLDQHNGAEMVTWMQDNAKKIINGDDLEPSEYHYIKEKKKFWLFR